jgi:outer membrane receptor protein involved in Fe transport
MTDRLKLTAGLRVARSKFSFNNAQDGPWNGGASFGSGNNTETPVTPKFSASYDLNHGLLYATAAKGYRIGGANASLGNNIACRDEVHNTLGIDDVPLSYDSDTVMSYEAGYKDRVAGGRLAFAASAYWINWNHIQGNVALECFWSYTTNLGKAVSRGADLSLRLQATDGLALGLDVGYGDAHYTEDFHLVNGTVLALKGDDLPTPDFTGAFSLDYERPMAWGRSYARAEYNYSSAYHRTPASGVHGADQTVRDIPSLGLLSARLGLRRSNGLDLSLFGNNLTNADERVFRYHYTGLSTTFLSQTVRPRTFGVTATWTFD